MADQREPDHEAVGIGIPPAEPLQASEDAASESPEETTDTSAPASEDDVAERAVAAAEARAEASDPDPEKVETDLRERVEDDFGIGRRAEGVAESFEDVPYLDVVVDLAVKRQPVAAVVARHRLRAAGEVDDAEACVGQAGGAQRPDDLRVRPAMAHQADHAAQGLAVYRRAISVHDSCDATHAVTDS